MTIESKVYLTNFKDLGVIFLKKMFYYMHLKYVIFIICKVLKIDRSSFSGKPGIEGGKGVTKFMNLLNKMYILQCTKN